MNITYFVCRHDKAMAKYKKVQNRKYMYTVDIRNKSVWQVFDNIKSQLKIKPSDISFYFLDIGILISYT